MQPSELPLTMLRSVLREYGLEGGSIEPIAEGRVNRHWRVDARNQAFVLRAYTLIRSRDAIAWEHEMVRHLAVSTDWPVAPPLLSPEGSLVEREGYLFSLFPLLSGSALEAATPASRRIRGRLMASLHRSMARFDRRDQREGFGRAWELDLLLGPAGVTFNEALAELGREHADLAAGVRRQRYRNLRELSRLGYGELAVAPVHCDFHTPNLLFDDGILSGVLDFDSARLDAPAFDIATSLFLDCTSSPDHNAIDLDLASAFVGGYNEIRPLSSGEVVLLPALIRAAILWLVAFRLLQWKLGIRDRGVRSVARSVEHRFPALEEMWLRLPGVFERAVSGEFSTIG